MSLTDEIIESYIEKKVFEKVTETLNEIADIMEKRIQCMTLGQSQYNDLMNLINQIRRQL